MWRKETRICQQNCFFHTTVNGIGHLSCSKLDIFDKKYVEFSDNACFTDGNPRSELINCGSLYLSISLILLMKLNTSLLVQFCFYEKVRPTAPVLAWTPLLVFLCFSKIYMWVWTASHKQHPLRCRIIICKWVKCITLVVKSLAKTVRIAASDRICHQFGACWTAVIQWDKTWGKAYFHQAARVIGSLSELCLELESAVKDRPVSVFWISTNLFANVSIWDWAPKAALHIAPGYKLVLTK